MHILNESTYRRKDISVYGLYVYIKIPRRILFFFKYENESREGKRAITLHVIAFLYNCDSKNAFRTNNMKSRGTHSTVSKLWEGMGK